MLKQLNSERLLVKIGPKNLLKHTVYIKWNKGELQSSTLQGYAKEYYHHVRNFPQCLSSLHSLAPSMKERQILLENLVEEDQGEKNHPQLWMNFANGLGLSDNEVHDAELGPATTDLVDTFRGLTRNSYKQGLGALFAHEYQYADISKTKKEGLLKWKQYGIKEESAEQDLEFFTVHSGIDEWHTQQLTDIIDGEGMNDEASYTEVEHGAVEAANSLWKFLDYIDERFEGENQGKAEAAICV